MEQQEVGSVVKCMSSMHQTPGCRLYHSRWTKCLADVKDGWLPLSVWRVSYWVGIVLWLAKAAITKLHRGQARLRQQVLIVSQFWSPKSKHWQGHFLLRHRGRLCPVPLLDGFPAIAAISTLQKQHCLKSLFFHECIFFLGPKLLLFRTPLRLD